MRMPSLFSLPTSLLFLLFLNSPTHPICHASNSVSQTQSLNGTQTITSKGGIFELGFFTPSKSSQRYYVGIWYKQIPEKTVVWVANRETPLPSIANSLLKISEDGNLVLLSPTNYSVWSTKCTSTAPTFNSIVAVLLDSGNLVLRDTKDPSVVHWESFAHPTHVFLPGGWLGMKNKTTGENARLTSWKSKEDPASGPFSSEIESNPISRIVTLWNGTETYLDSGVWDGEKFLNAPKSQSSHVSFINNQTAKYFTYALVVTEAHVHYMLDISGHVKIRFWFQGSNRWKTVLSLPTCFCDVYAACGAFGSCNELDDPTFCRCLPGFIPRVQKDWDLGGWSDGCMRRTPIHMAENSMSEVETDRFWALHHMKLPAASESISVASSPAACKWACLNKSSCTAYAFESGCMIWNGELLNLKQLSGIDVGGKKLFLRLAASEVPTSKNKNGIVAGIVVGLTGLAAAIAGGLSLRRRYQRHKRMALAEAVARGCLVPFRYRDLQSFTKNFSEKLGEGGFGSVFKGTLPNLTMVAVKKLHGACQGDKQFRAEVSTIGTIQHVNLIRLRGFCSDSKSKLLVYDYMPNGSLDSHLFRTEKTCLDWSRRYQIAIEIARGLAYLHEKCRDCIIHCDIKPENILLDDGLSVKIADFGLAKLFGRDFSQVLTTLRGTIGYLAPEWISGLAITTKADVYSYGMMLFEIISGRRNKKESREGQAAFFPAWAMSKISEGDLARLLDSRLEGNVDMEELNRACRVAGWCIQDDENERPFMGQIVLILEGALELSVPPIPRLLQILDENSNTISSFMLSSSMPPSEIKSCSWSPSSRCDDSDS